MKGFSFFHGLPLYCHLCGELVDGFSLILCQNCLKEIEKMIQVVEVSREGITSQDFRIFSLLDYHRSGEIFSFVSKIKFENQRMLLLTLLENIKDWSFLPPFQEIWCVPSSFRKFLERGYHPSQTVAKFLSRKFKTPFKKRLKKRDGLSQSSKTRSERLKIGDENLFYVSKVFGRPMKKITTLLLVDDIVTTGATLSITSRKIREVLEPSKAQILCFTLFHTEEKHIGN